jgi:hypothetical protein
MRWLRRGASGKTIANKQRHFARCGLVRGWLFRRKSLSCFVISESGVRPKRREHGFRLVKISLVALCPALLFGVEMGKEGIATADGLDPFLDAYRLG